MKTPNPSNKNSKKQGDFSKFINKNKKRNPKPIIEKPEISKPKKIHKPHRIKKMNFDENALVRLNKFVANAGICSRREADNLIQSGKIKVNGKIVSELGTKVSFKDKVEYNKKILFGETLKYVLLNKPKGYITTMNDPQERRTVVSLIENACQERIYPVGRLDQNTSGLLLFTNDGELTKKLTHPKHLVKKIYHVFLDKDFAKNDMIKIIDGIELDDGNIKVDAISYVESEIDKKQVGIEIHSGRNRIVRRIFETLDYRITKLDRVTFANLTKKNLPRGKWRFLTEKEISFLKMIK